MKHIGTKSLVVDVTGDVSPIHYSDDADVNHSHKETVI